MVSKKCLAKLSGPTKHRQTNTDTSGAAQSTWQKYITSDVTSVLSHCQKWFSANYHYKGLIPVALPFCMLKSPQCTEVLSVVVSQTKVSSSTMAIQNTCRANNNLSSFWKHLFMIFSVVIVYYFPKACYFSQTGWDSKRYLTRILTSNCNRLIHENYPSMDLILHPQLEWTFSGLYTLNTVCTTTIQNFVEVWIKTVCLMRKKLQVWQTKACVRFTSAHHKQLLSQSARHQRAKMLHFQTSCPWPRALGAGGFSHTHTICVVRNAMFFFEECSNRGLYFQVLCLAAHSFYWILMSLHLKYRTGYQWLCCVWWSVTLRRDDSFLPRDLFRSYGFYRREADMS